MNVQEIDLNIKTSCEGCYNNKILFDREAKNTIIITYQFSLNCPQDKILLSHLKCIQIVLNFCLVIRVAVLQ